MKRNRLLVSGLLAAAAERPDVFPHKKSPSRRALSYISLSWLTGKIFRTSGNFTARSGNFVRGGTVLEPPPRNQGVYTHRREMSAIG
jgi:hypothetical protein